MKTLRSKLKSTTLAVLASSAVMAASSAAYAAPEKYTLDASHTAITWHIDHFGFSKPSGKFMDVVGSVMIDQETPANSSVEVTIPIEKINTGVAALDEHLLKADFFNVEEFPTATFTSKKVDVLSETTAKVEGDLTLHGLTKPVVLDVTLNKLAVNMFEKQTAGFTATTTIKRSDFGIVAYLPNLGDDITIEIESEANLAEAE